MAGASRTGVAHAAHCRVVNGIRNAPKRAADVVARHAVVVRQFNHRAALLTAITDERERIFFARGDPWCAAVACRSRGCRNRSNAERRQRAAWFAEFALDVVFKS